MIIGRKVDKYKWISFLLCIIMLFICEFIFREKLWTCDVADYWQRGDLLRNSGFSLESIDGFRGYVFPLYLGITNALGGRIGWYIINAVLVSAFVTWIVPFMVSDNVQSGRKQIVSICVFMAMLCIFFVGVLVYPLSDMFAAMNICIAILCMRKASKVNNGILSIVLLLLAGSFCYLAYNTRTIYMFAGIATVLVYSFQILENKGLEIKRRILRVLSAGWMFGGVIIAAIPQLVMNIKNQDGCSIMVPTQGLMLSQVFWGIKWQRYDTYIPSTVDSTHPNPQVYFIDATGMQLLADTQMSVFNSWGDYFLFFIQHPIDVILIYIRHMVNYLFPCWPQVYVNDLNSSKWLLGLLGFSLFFIVILAFHEKCCVNNKNSLWYIPLITPAILIIPGAVEYRFSLPIYLVAFCQICYNIEYKRLRDIIVKKFWKILFAYILFGIMCFTIWANMLANESVTPLLFSMI